jgi:hypothetical protein
MQKDDVITTFVTGFNGMQGNAIYLTVMLFCIHNRISFVSIKSEGKQRTTHESCCYTSNGSGIGGLSAFQLALFLGMHKEDTLFQCKKPPIKSICFLAFARLKFYFNSAFL